MISPQRTSWSPFLRALAEEVDSLGGPDVRDTLLREVGRRMARFQPLPFTTRMDVMELDANETLAALGWGSVSFRVAEQDHALLIDHAAWPSVGGAGDPPGSWLSAVLEGLYEGWMAQLPGADPSLTVRRVRVGLDSVLLQYSHS